MFHFNCENDDAEAVAASIDAISERFGAALDAVEWVSPRWRHRVHERRLPARALRVGVAHVRRSPRRAGLLEPGEAVITQTAELVVSVLDVVHNEIDVAVVDAAVEPHMPDHLIYGTSPRLASHEPGDHRVMIAGRTCLAGDVFGDYRVNTPLRVGDEVRFADAAGYTMVKANWFNGVTRPSIVVRRLDGSVDVVRRFGYEDFESDLS